MTTLSRRAWLPMLCVLLTACATSTPPPLNDSDARIQLAARTFGGRFDYLYIPTGGTVQDTAFVTASKVSRSDLSRDLATKLAPAEKQPVRIMVTGPSAEKTLQVIRDALSFHSDGGLPQLEFLFVGDTQSAGVIEPLVRAKGGNFRFTPY